MHQARKADKHIAMPSPLLRKDLLELLFSGAYMLRWNDRLRPVELLEIDKQGHKMLVACLLWHENSLGMPADEKLALGSRIIGGALCDYFYRLIITDIKPPVFYRIRENPEHHRRLTEYVLKRLDPVLSPLGPFRQAMLDWHGDPAGHGLAGRILDAAQLYASRWESAMIRPLNPFDDEMESIGQSFEERLASFGDLAAMQEILDRRSSLGNLANLCGRLRFQIRWTLAPRIPATSVLGHMFVVACLAYFFSLSLGACRARTCNNFFAGLFHDLPELLTRDIISPVKQSVKELPGLIRDYELAELERCRLGRLRGEGHQALSGQVGYYLGLEAGSEFQDCRREDGRTIPVAGFDALHRLWNGDEHDPKDGQMLKACDWLAAMLEAHSTVRNGVSAPQMQAGAQRLRRQLLEDAPAELGLEAILADLEREDAEAPPEPPGTAPAGRVRP